MNGEQTKIEARLTLVSRKHFWAEYALSNSPSHFFKIKNRKLFQYDTYKLYHLLKKSD